MPKKRANDEELELLRKMDRFGSQDRVDREWRRAKKTFDAIAKSYRKISRSQQRTHGLASPKILSAAMRFALTGKAIEKSKWITPLTKHATALRAILSKANIDPVAIRTRFLEAAGEKFRGTCSGPFGGAWQWPSCGATEVLQEKEEKNGI